MVEYDKRFRVFFTINPIYHSRNIANSISSQPFWYHNRHFRTILATDATEFVSADTALNMVDYHAKSEDMLHLMLEFYSHTLEVRHYYSSTWAPIDVYNSIDNLTEI